MDSLQRDTDKRHIYILHFLDYVFNWSLNKNLKYICKLFFTSSSSPDSCGCHHPILFIGYNTHTHTIQSFLHEFYTHHVLSCSLSRSLRVLTPFHQLLECHMPWLPSDPMKFWAPFMLPLLLLLLLLLPSTPKRRPCKERRKEKRHCNTIGDRTRRDSSQLHFVRFHPSN